MENLHAVGHAKFPLRRALRMRHHAENIAAFIADARDVLQRTIGIRVGSDLASRAMS